MMNLDDREVVDQISIREHLHAILSRLSEFFGRPPFDPSLFVEFRKKLGVDQVNAINEKIISLKTHLETPNKRRNQNLQTRMMLTRVLPKMETEGE